MRQTFCERQPLRPSSVKNHGGMHIANHRLYAQIPGVSVHNSFECVHLEPIAKATIDASLNIFCLVFLLDFYLYIPKNFHVLWKFPIRPSHPIAVLFVSISFGTIAAPTACPPVT